MMKYRYDPDIDQEFTNKLLEIKKYYFDPAGGDQEIGHEEADAILIELLKELGYKQTVEVYETISERFWYA